MKFGDIVLRKDEVSGEEYLELSTERESKTRTTAKKMSTEDLSVRKRTRQATENVQCLASKSLSTGDKLRPNHRKVLSSWLFITGENQKIKFGS